MFKFSNRDAKQWSRMGPRAMFGQFMLDLAKKHENLMVISADLGRSSGLDRFKKLYPDKYLSVGIGEQNMIGVAAGLSREGYKVFVTSFAPFLSMRSSEQIRMNLGYMKHSVNLVALGSGISMAYLGNSHFGLEDLAVIRSIPNMNISIPADCCELGKILSDYCEKDHGPSYIRLTGIPGFKNVYEKNYNYVFGKPIIIKPGKDIIIFANGTMVAESLEAANILSNKGINVELVNVHTLKPLDNLILKKIKSFKNIITVEEHTSIGGLGSAISEIIAKNSISTNFLPISLPDKFGPTGTYKFLLDYHGLTGPKIAKKILKKIY